MKETKYNNARKEQNRKSNRNTIPKIYMNMREDLEQYESEEDQINAMIVEVGYNFND